MYKLSISLIIFGSFLCFSAFGNESNSGVRGKVVAEMQHPLEGVYVVVLTYNDSSFVTGTVSEKDGGFVIKSILAGRYKLRVSMLGYKKETRIIVLEAGKSLTLTPIQMEEEATNLNEVVIQSNRPEIELMADKTVVNVESSALNSGGSAFSVMQNLPGVLVSNNGTIFLNGKSGAKIMIDGKASYLEGIELVSYLKSTPATTLEKIELITNPSAKYDASGNSGIINIKTKRVKLMGFNASLNTNYEHGKFGRTNDNITLNHNNGKFNIYGTYSLNVGQNMIDLQILRKFDANSSTPNTTFVQNSYRKRKDETHYFNGGIHYFASEKTTFELSAKGYVSNRQEHGIINSSFYIIEGQNDSTLNSTTLNPNITKNISSSFGLFHEIDSMGKELNASVDYLHYSVNGNQLNDNVSSSSITNKIVESRTKGIKVGSIGMYSGRVDLTYHISKNFSFEAGAKSTIVEIDNASSYSNLAEAGWHLNYGLSNRFIYNENINASYISTKISANKIRVEAGVRVENTNVKGHLLGNEEQADSTFTKSYTNIFPTATLTYIFENKNTLNLIFGRRVNRPNYRDLNPFVYIFDPYTYEQGNTALRPQFSNNFDMTYIIKGNYRVNLFFNNTQHAIVKSYVVKSDSKRIYVMPTNMATYNSYGIKISTANIQILKFWQASLNTGITQNDYNWQQDEIAYKNHLATFMLQINNRLKLPKDWSGELNGFYNSKMALGQITVFSLWQLSAGIQKKLWKGNATLGIFSSDIFNSNHSNVSGTFIGSSATTNEKQDRCIIGVSFSYRFQKGYTTKELKRKGESFDTKRINL